MDNVGHNVTDMLELLARMKRESDVSYYCRDGLDSDVASEQQHLNQAQRFLKTARKDAGDDRPEGSDYLILALIGKDMLSQSRREVATVMTGVTLAFRSLEPVEIDEVGSNYAIALNWSIYNMRNKLLHDWFHTRGIWALVNNNMPFNMQYDKIHAIRTALQFRVDDPLRHDIYLIKTINYAKYAPSHYVLLINKYCFHLTNVGLFAGDYRRLKANLFQKISSFERVGTTTMDVVSIDFSCQTLASQSHSLLFNNCQNFATNVYELICEEKGVKVELPSFSGATVIIQALMFVVVCLGIFIVITLSK